MAEILDINGQACSLVVSELIASGDLIEEGFASSTGGRKPRLLDLEPERGSVIGLTFSSRGIASAWADFKGRLSNITTYPFSPADGKARTLEAITGAVADQLRAVPDASKVVQIGVGLSGLLDRKKGVSIGFPRFDEWAEVPLRQLIEKQFSVPVVLDNHIAAIALAESVYGNYRGFENALYVQLGPGLGVGIVIGGRIYRGSKLSVGEFGHTSVTDNGPICYCGNYGCLESVASDYALVQQAEAAVREGVSTRIPELVSQPGRITPGSIFRAAREGDRFAINLVEKVGQMLGTGIGNLVNLFGPELVILGGSMAEAGDMIFNPICHALRTKALNRMEKDVEIKTASFGQEEGLKGAVTLALHTHFASGLQPGPGRTHAGIV